MKKLLDCMVRRYRSFDSNKFNMLQSAPSLARKKIMAKARNKVSNARDQHDEVPSGSRCFESEPHVQKKRYVMTEDLNVPAQKYIDINKIKQTLVGINCF